MKNVLQKVDESDGQSHQKFAIMVLAGIKAVVVFLVYDLEVQNEKDKGFWIIFIDGGNSRLFYGLQ